MEKSVIIKNKSDEKIYGIIHIPQKRPSGKEDVFIFLHGWLGCKAGPHRLFVKIARSLMLFGYLSLRFDFRGRGSSQTISEVTIPTLLDDARTVIDFIIRKKKVNQVNLIGLSMGSIIALLLKNEDIKRRISRIILLSPLPYTEKIRKYSFEPVYKFNINTDYVRLIFGENDPVKNVAIASYKDIFGDNIIKRIQEIKDAEHGFYSSLADEMIIKSIIGFVEKGR